MKDLIEFLRAQLDADEQAAADAAYSSGGNDWVYRDFGIDEKGRREGTLQLADEVPIDSTDLERAVNMDGHQMFHIARHDPARVLREVEANRNLVDAALLAEHDLNYMRARPPADAAVRAEMLARYEARWAAWVYVLRQLALPYADHPGCREEWKP